MLQKIWFNRHFQGTFTHINALMDTGQYSVYVSHVKDSVPSMQENGHLSRQGVSRFKEPEGLSMTKYVDWCLAFCKEHGVDVFVPGKAKEQVAGHKKRFEAIGTKVLVAGSEYTMRLLDRKDKFLALTEGVVPTAPWQVFQTRAEFEAAWTAMGEGKQGGLCVKPVQGIYGSGFWRLSTDIKSTQLFSKTTLPVEQFKARMGSGLPERWLLMRYCADDERSVDCVAHKGTLVAAVVRRKTVHGLQEVENNPQVMAYAAALIKRFRLSGLVNVQFKEHEGVYYVLEINPRASGGSGMAYFAGVPLMPLAVEALLNDGRVNSVPPTVFGVKIQKTHFYFTVNDEGLPHDSH